ncbi:MAG: ribbon-helix-helix protein, CopG family [Alphaproteobacteria bacterium]|nr:ribbon-helix-helix protein, CopG family [Alphaproteobacteria bacterium]
MKRYLAFLHPDATGGYGVAFPDFPGCVSAGDSLPEAIDQAARALRFHVDGMIEDGTIIPEPRDVNMLRDSPRHGDELREAVIVPVPLLPPRGKAVRVNITVDQNLLRAIDTTATERGLSRSAFIAEASRRMLEDVV